MGVCGPCSCTNRSSAVLDSLVGTHTPVEYPSYFSVLSTRHVNFIHIFPSTAPFSQHANATPRVLKWGFVGLVYNVALSLVLSHERLEGSCSFIIIGNLLHQFILFPLITAYAYYTHEERLGAHLVRTVTTVHCQLRARPQRLVPEYLPVE